VVVVAEELTEPVARVSKAGEVVHFLKVSILLAEAVVELEVQARLLLKIKQEMVAKAIRPGQYLA